MNNPKQFSYYVLPLLLISLSSVAKQHVLPTPQSVTHHKGSFILTPQMNIFHSEMGEQTAFYLQTKLATGTGMHLTLSQADSKNNGVLLTENGVPDTLGEEGYVLEVKLKQIIIRAHTEKGFFYGVQSLLQLFPPEIFSQNAASGIQWETPCVKIVDEPKYAWRGFMLDSGRQYQTPEFIKRYLEHMAMLKMNVFHWHLTEGQGWRIEIKKYPKLTEVGSKVAKGKQQQGYYTQEEIKDIVAFAKKLHIRVVPEIDVPGHSEAALMAYPELTCFNEAPESVMGFSPNLFCGGSEKTYTFLENVLDEVCQLFPSEYIHLGGDEAPKANWKKCPVCQQKIKEKGLKNEHQLQLYFSWRLAKYMQLKERKAIFWGDVIYHEEIRLPDNVVIQWWNWRGHRDLALRNAIKREVPVICSTNYYSYLNFPVTPWLPKYKKNRTFDIMTTYCLNPSDMLSPPSNVIGMEACMWTDWHVLQDMVDMRVFPRIYSLAEQMWHRGKRISFNDFYKRLKAHYPVLKYRGIDYGPAMEEEINANFKWE